MRLNQNIDKYHKPSNGYWNRETELLAEHIGTNFYAYDKFTNMIIKSGKFTDKTAREFVIENPYVYRPLMGKRNFVKIKWQEIADKLNNSLYDEIKSLLITTINLLKDESNNGKA